MANAALLDQVRLEMKVYTCDRKKLGTVRLVHQREPEVYIEVETERAIWLRRSGFLFLSLETVDTAAGNCVTLTVDAQTAKGYTYRPRWFVEKIDEPVIWG